MRHGQAERHLPAPAHPRARSAPRSGLWLLEVGRRHDRLPVAQPRRRLRRQGHARRLRHRRRERRRSPVPVRATGCPAYFQAARALRHAARPARQRLRARRQTRPATAPRPTCARSTSAARTSAASPTSAPRTTGSSAPATARATTAWASRSLELGPGAAQPRPLRHRRSTRRASSPSTPARSRSGRCPSRSASRASSRRKRPPGAYERRAIGPGARTPRPPTQATARWSRRAPGRPALERFDAGERAHRIELTEERAAGIVRQSGTARAVAFWSSCSSSCSSPSTGSTSRACRASPVRAP